jgi:hypothetical protein
LFLSLCAAAEAAGFWQVRIQRGKDQPLQALRLEQDSIEIEDLEIDKQVVPVLKVSGEFLEPGVSLLFDNIPLVTSERRTDEFVLTVPLTGIKTSILLTTVAHDGLTNREKVDFLFADYPTYMAVQMERRRPGMGLSPSVGITQLSYTEAGVAPYSAVMLSGKIGLQFALAPPVWDGAINIFGNLLPLIPDSSGNVARFIGINARVGYVVKQVRDPWRLSLMGGSGNAFGFKDVSGPQFFPLIRRKFSDSRGVYGYIKYAPVAAGGRITSLGDRELALGLGGNWVNGRNTPLSLSLDIADLSAELSGVPISCRTATLSLGTSL